MNRIITTSFLALALAACGSGNDDAAPAGEAPDGGFGDSPKVVPEEPAVAFGAALAQSFAALAAARHRDERT